MSELDQALEELNQEADAGFEELSKALVPYEEIVQENTRLHALVSDLYAKCDELHRYCDHLNSSKVVQRDEFGNAIAVNGRPIIRDETGKILGLK